MGFIGGVRIGEMSGLGRGKVTLRLYQFWVPFAWGDTFRVTNPICAIRCGLPEESMED